MTLQADDPELRRRTVVPHDVEAPVTNLTPDTPPVLPTGARRGLPGDPAMR